MQKKEGFEEEEILDFKCVISDFFVEILRSFEDCFLFFRVFILSNTIRFGPGLSAYLSVCLQYDVSGFVYVLVKNEIQRVLQLLHDHFKQVIKADRARIIGHPVLWEMKNRHLVTVNPK